MVPLIPLAISHTPSFIAEKNFIERIPYHYVEQLCTNDCLKDKWDSLNYSQVIASQNYINEKEQLKSYLSNYNKKLNAFSVKYHKPKHKWGRVFVSKSLGLTSFAKKTRNTLIKDSYYDFDLKNAQPEILRCICEANHIPCDIVTKYCNDRETIISDIMQQGSCSRELVKSLIISLSFYGSFNGWLKQNNIQEFPEPIIVKQYSDEIRIIANVIKAANPDFYKTIERNKKEKKEGNIMGSFLSSYLQEYELRVVENVVKYLCTDTAICWTEIPNTFLLTYEFDGLKLYKDSVIRNSTVDALILKMNKLNKLIGFDIKWELKPIEKFYDICFESPSKTPKELKEELKTTEERIKEEGKAALLEASLLLKNTQTSLYLKMKEEFELTHCKIISKAIYMQKNDSKYSMRTKKQIVDAYEHLVYHSYTDEFGRDIKLHFIHEWIKDPSIKCYNDFGVFPNASKCPIDVLNVWVPFVMELYTDDYEIDTEGRDFILNHLNILCDRETITYDYFLLWIAQMIQHPEFKSTCPVLIGRQGSGKGTFMELMKKILGSDKVFITAQPDKYVWGNFNTLMTHAFLVGFDEMTKTMTTSAVEFIKNLITDSNININDKGFSAYTLPSFHHFMMMTNKDDGGISTTEDDRRKLMIRTSDELIGNTEYFKKFYAYLENERVMRSVYDYFKHMDNVPTMLPPPPQTEYQDNLKILTENHYIRWLKDFVMVSYNDKQTLLGDGSAFTEKDNMFYYEGYSRDAYKFFCKWRDQNGEVFDTTPLKMAVNIKNLRLSGIYKGKATKIGVMMLFNLTELKKHFNLGCLIDLPA